MILVAGVNGTGKTTTVGKLAWHLGKELGQTVVVGAADTFRAAARRAARGVGPARRRRVRQGPAERGPRVGRVRRDRRRAPRRRRRRDHRHGGAAPHPGRPDGRAGEGQAGDLQADPGGAARDAAHGRRHHRAERPSPGAPVLRGGRRQRARADQARRHRQGRDRARDRPRARHPRQADRDRRAARGPAPVRLGRLRPGARHRPDAGRGSAERAERLADLAERGPRAVR